MKKIFVVGLSMLLVAQSLIADTDTEYNRKRLVIQFYSGVSGSWDEEGGGFSSYSDWRFHQGFVKISEAEFLEIAGYVNESRDAAAHERLFKTRVGWAIGLFGAGGVVMAGSILSISNRSFSKESQYVGMVISSALLLSGIVPIVLLRLQGKHWMPLEQAYSIAEDYNRNLLESLK